MATGGINLNLSSVAQSPDPEFDVRAQGKAFPTAGLGNDEATLLEEQMNDLMTPFSGSVVGDLFKQRQDAIGLTAAFAKQVFDEKLFGGVNAGDNEIGFDVLRPGHIYSDSSGTIQNDWSYTASSSGWGDWIGDGATNNYTFGEDQVSVVFGILDQDTSSEITAVNVEEFGRNVDMLPQDMNALKVRDNETEQQIKPLPNLIGQENDDVHIRLRSDEATESQPRLLGVTFGLGTFLDSEDY